MLAAPETCAVSAQKLSPAQRFVLLPVTAKERNTLMPTIHDVETVRRPAIPSYPVASFPASAPASAKAVAKALALIALVALGIGAAAVALTVFIVLPPLS
jgi:hypothetical protein